MLLTCLQFTCDTTVKIKMKCQKVHFDKKVNLIMTKFRETSIKLFYHELKGDLQLPCRKQSVELSILYPVWIARQKHC